MDIFIFLIFIASTVFGAILLFSDSMKFIEKVVGASTFFAIATISGGVLIAIAYYVTPTYVVTKTTKFVEIDKRIENYFRITKEQQHCDVTIDESFPLMVFLGNSAEVLYEVPCSLIMENEYTKTDINNKIASWKRK